MFYFAYGSNMDPVQMEERCPGAVALGAAHLPGWRLTFTRRDKSEAPTPRLFRI